MKKSNLKLVLIALILSIGLSLVVLPIIAKAQVSDTQPVLPTNVVVGVDASSGFQRVFVDADGTKIFISPENFNSFSPVTDGQYIAFVTQIDGAGQIFLYDLASGFTTQLTSSSTNLNPSISFGRVVWEGWIQDKWQIFLYDGVGVRQITSGDVAFNPEIESGEVVFARQDNQGGLRAEKYDILQDATESLGNGFDKRYPGFASGQVAFNPAKSKKTSATNQPNTQPLNVPSLAGSSQAQEVTEEQVQNELTPPQDNSSPQPSISPQPSSSTVTESPQPNPSVINDSTSSALPSQ